LVEADLGWAVGRGVGQVLVVGPGGPLGDAEGGDACVLAFRGPDCRPDVARRLDFGVEVEGCADGGVVVAEADVVAAFAGGGDVVAAAVGGAAAAAAADDDDAAVVVVVVVVVVDAVVAVVVAAAAGDDVDADFDHVGVDDDDGGAGDVAAVVAAGYDWRWAH